MESSSPGRRARAALFVALRAAFRTLPISETTRDALRSGFLRVFPAVRPLPTQGRIGASVERRPRVQSGERLLGYVERSEPPLPVPLPATLIAFYLPQFHVIPENDAWWGKGFTEWRNVARALPQFEGHLQPRLPGEFGFYDLRNPQVMREQATLARAYGLSAFCFYFYWFDGRTLLEEPLRSWLADRSIDFHYCLCWANENWTRRWDGRDGEVLIAQRHSPDDDLAFIAHVADYLRDPRYLRVEGRPVLLLYRPMLLPDPKASAGRWRAWCREHGIGEIHLAYVQSFERPDPRDIGFDAAVEFPPNLGESIELTGSRFLLNPDYAGEVLDWRTMATSFQNRPVPPYRLHRGVNCGWDNEPRRPGAGRTWLHATPARYSQWLRHVVGTVSPTEPIFINAWNEWAEGAILEPDAAHGHAWLQATADALHATHGTEPRHATPARPCVVIHAWYTDVFAEVLRAVHAQMEDARILVTTTADRRRAVEDTADTIGVMIEVMAVENRGRDILPFLKAARLLHEQGEDIVLKLHTKASLHRRDGEQWRHDMIGKIVLDGHATQLYERMSSDPRIGIVCPREHEHPLEYYWGANEHNVRSLCTQLGIQAPDPQRDKFVSGSMFWVRLDSISQLLELDVGALDFDREKGQVDGTLAHAIERLFALCAWGNGALVLDSDLRDIRSTAATAYGFAARS